MIGAHKHKMRQGLILYEVIEHIKRASMISYIYFITEIQPPRLRKHMMKKYSQPAKCPHPKKGGGKYESTQLSLCQSLAHIENTANLCDVSKKTLTA